MTDHDTSHNDTGRRALAGGHDEGGHGGELARQGDPFADPGLPAHQPRRTDIDQRAAWRAERQVSLLFIVSALATLGFIVVYFLVPKDASLRLLGFGTVGASTFLLGICLGLALFCIGAGAIHWARVLMADEELVDERHPMRSTDEERATAVAQLRAGNEESGFGRRSLIRRSLIGALGALPLSAIVLLRDLGPLPRKKLRQTAWTSDSVLINENTGQPLKPEDVPVGALAFARPSNLDPASEDYDTQLAKAAVLLVRLAPEEIHDDAERAAGYEGIVCYSKICTHVGCPVGLYEQQTHHLLCPCHQSTFDLTDGGKVIFGPAARSLPQLAIEVDQNGNLKARGDFTEPVGPSFWERG